MSLFTRSSLLVMLVVTSALANPELDLPASPETFNPVIPPPPTDQPDPRDEPPPIFFGEEIQSPNETLVYVLDYSGSMTGGGRIEALRREITLSISQLAPTFRFNVVIYDCVMKQWSPELQPANEGGKTSAIGWIDEMPLLGGVGLVPAPPWPSDSLIRKYKQLYYLRTVTPTVGLSTIA